MDLALRRRSLRRHGLLYAGSQLLFLLSTFGHRAISKFIGINKVFTLHNRIANFYNHKVLSFLHLHALKGRHSENLWRNCQPPLGLSIHPYRPEK